MQSKGSTLPVSPAFLVSFDRMGSLIASIAASATQKLKETAGVKSGEVKGKVAEATGEAKGSHLTRFSFLKLKGDTGKAAELEGKAKSKIQ